MTKKNRTKLSSPGQQFLREQLLQIGLLVGGSVLFALSFPGIVSDKGFFPLAFISLIPVFVLVHRSSWKLIPLYGVAYGFLSYALFNYWLTTFHPMAILIVPVIYAFYFLIAFPALKLADTLFPKYGYLVQLIIWIAYEYLRTQGFLGYPYGNIGYSQYLFIPFIQISALTGVWGVTALTVFPSAFLGNAVKDGFNGLNSFIRTHRITAGVFVVLTAAVLVYGAAVQHDYSEEKQWKVALIQHNADTWEGGIRTFRRNLDILVELSEKALEEDPDIVVWSETAFVPGVDWHTKYRTDPDRYELVKTFREFMQDQEVPFVTGNNDGQLKDPHKPPVLSDGSHNRLDYNAVLMYHENELKTIYRKTHLVPFTEHFPYENIMPRFHQLLVDNEYRFWEKGMEYTVFEADGVKFATPICFEDVFGYLSRRFVEEGAEVIVNLTNDGWSGSVAAQMQHLGMAVFRSVETRRSMVRSSNSGMTATIDPDGRIVDMLDPFVRDYMVTSVPVYTEKTTLYSRWGNWFAHAALIGALGLLIGGSIVRVLHGRRRGKTSN
ncbi:MAG: apolipoprotein N-acyltransferase [Spirochaetaceae bacterium]